LNSLNTQTINPVSLLSVGSKKIEAAKQPFLPYLEIKQQIQIKPVHLFQIQIIAQVVIRKF